jgi:cytochrome c oxidase subunit II
MIGWVTVMEPTAFENWLSGGGAEGSMASQGEKLFQQLGCSTCHLLDEQGRCPIMRGVYGSQVLLDDGRTILADDAYVRESILNPNAKIVSGFHKDVMPTFQGQVTEENLLQLIEYIKSLAVKKGALAPQGATIPNRQGANAQATGNAATGRKK